MTTKADVIAYFKTAPLAEALTVLEVGTVICDMRRTETPAKKRGRPEGSRSKKAANKTDKNFLDGVMDAT